MSEKQQIDSKEKSDTTNWGAWYLGLIIFLAVQIIVYLWITKWYEA